MSSDPTRRFTEREVAIVLRKASEIDENEGVGAGSGMGLSLEDLQEIAKEVGISPQAISRAAQAIEEPGRLSGAWAGAPLVRKAVRAVPGELNEAAIAGLIRVVDERADAAGSISEALGSVRWTASDRFKSSLVSITPQAGETSIQVVEKAAPRLRRVFHMLPAAWAVMIATPMIGAAGLGAAAGLTLAAGSMVAGAGIGRVVWNLLSSQSTRRVERLAAELSQEAHGAAERGLLAPISDDD